MNQPRELSTAGNPPLYIPAEDHYYSPWLKYVYQYFMGPRKEQDDEYRKAQYYNTENQYRAIIYNLECLDENICLSNVIKWSSLLNSIENNARISNQHRPGVIGEAYRLLFDKSDQSPEVKNHIRHNPAFSIGEQTSFLYTESPFDFTIFDKFKDSLNVFDIISKFDSDSMDFNTHNPQTYLWNYIYTREFSNQIRETIPCMQPNVEKVFHNHYLTEAFRTKQELDDICNSHLITNEQRLNYIGSVLCSVTYLTNRPIYKNLEKSLDLFATQTVKFVSLMFEEYFPEQYKQYQTLTSLGITPTLEEFQHLNNNIDAIIMPELFTI